jgi:hypothetical protein
MPQLGLTLSATPVATVTNTTPVEVPKPAPKPKPKAVITQPTVEAAPLTVCLSLLPLFLMFQVVVGGQQVRALFDFDGNYQPGCLNLVKGETIELLLGPAGLLVNVCAHLPFRRAVVAGS